MRKGIDVSEFDKWAVIDDSGDPIREYYYRMEDAERAYWELVDEGAGECVAGIGVLAFEEDSVEQSVEEQRRHLQLLRIHQMSRDEYVEEIRKSIEGPRGEK